MRVETANLVEVVKLFRFNYTTQERLALQVFPRAQTHADNVRLPATRINACPRKDTGQVLVRRTRVCPQPLAKYAFHSPRSESRRARQPR
jgi:hypothetical protein